METWNQSPITLHGNPEHASLRTTVILALLLFLWIAFILIRLLIQQFAPPAILDYTVALTCSTSLLLGLALAWATEKILKQVWHSGVSVTLEEAGAKYTTKKLTRSKDEGYSISFDRGSRLNVSRWRFGLQGYKRSGRERRVTEKHICFAVEIQQDENQLTVFSYLSPSQAKKWLNISDLQRQFHELDMQKLHDQEKRRSRFAPPLQPNKIPTHLLTKRDGRYWLAERRRWRKGVELTAKDFEIFMAYTNSWQGVNNV